MDERQETAGLEAGIVDGGTGGLRVLVGSFALTFGLCAFVCSLTEAGEGSVKGDLRIHDLESKVFGNHPKLRVWLPPGYEAQENSQKRYPVLYLNDGQTLFDSAASSSNPQEWEADETASKLITAGIVCPLIIVGIDNAGRSERANEYLPYYDEFLKRKGISPRRLLIEVAPCGEHNERFWGNRFERALSFLFPRKVSP